MIASCRKVGCGYRGAETYRHDIAPGVWTRLCRKHHGHLTSLFARAGSGIGRSLTAHERVLLSGWFHHSAYYLYEERISKATARKLLQSLRVGQTIPDDRLLQYRQANVARDARPIMRPRKSHNRFGGTLKPSTVATTAVGLYTQDPESLASLAWRDNGHCKGSL